MSKDTTNTKALQPKQPLLHIVRRADLAWWKSWLFRIGAFVISCIVCLIIINSVTGAGASDVWKALVKSFIGSSTSVGEAIKTIQFWAVIRETLLLLGIALALVPAFKMRFWNIGARGQFFAGALTTAIVMKFLTPYMSTGMLFVTMIVGSVLAGALWGVIPAIFKAKWNTNETLFTLMMNYIMVQIVAYCSIIWAAREGAPGMGVINKLGSEFYMKGWFATDIMSGVFSDKNDMIMVFIVAALAAFMWVYMNRTKRGYEISVVGESENTARYAGINVKSVIIRTMLLSGAICGLIGFMMVSGYAHTVSVDTEGMRGFTAIIVTWLGKFKVGYMALVSLLLSLLSAGTSQLATSIGLKETLADVLVGIVLFFIIGSEFFVNYKIKFRKKEGTK